MSMSPVPISGGMHAQVIAAHPNICKQLHMPAQSGSSAVLQRMRRGYTREAYDALIQRVRGLMPEVRACHPPASLSCPCVPALPVDCAHHAHLTGSLGRAPVVVVSCPKVCEAGLAVLLPSAACTGVAAEQVALSTDLISGFCGETEEDHAATLDLLQRTGYDQAFLFAYSRRDKTHAARHLQVRALWWRTTSALHLRSVPLRAMHAFLQAWQSQDPRGLSRHARWLPAPASPAPVTVGAGRQV